MLYTFLNRSLKNATLRCNKLTSILPKKKIITEIEGRKLKLSNLDKPLFPDLGIVKAELIQYYLNIAPYILPHLRNRPLTLIRYPEGVNGHRFYSKNKPSWTPEWIETVRLSDDDDNVYVMANDVPSLVWMANLAALELHPMLTTSLLPNKPDHFIFDLDPPASADFEVVKQLALRLKPFLESFGYQPFVKTSGSKGLHIYVPIKRLYEQTEVLESIKDLAKKYIKIDKTTTLKINKEKRQGRVLLDIYRNHKSQTCVAPYSTRGKKGAPISSPIYWDELNDLNKSQAFSINTILEKLKVDGDPWVQFREDATLLHTDDVNDASESVVVHKIIPLKGIQAAIEDIELKPMLATLGSTIPHPKKFSYEIKWDGIRIIAIKSGNQVSIISRKGNDLTDKFPTIRDFILDQSEESFIVDGELVVLNEDGTPNFSKVVGRMHLNGSESIKRAARKGNVIAYLFDVLYSNGKDIRSLPLEYRRDWLKSNLEWKDQLRFSESFDDGKQLLVAIRAQNMEGIMCKLKGSKYASNTRSSTWIKIKVQNEDSALIIGFTKGKGDRSKLFGALHLAKKEKDEYVYLGKVGTGFNQDKMKEIAVMLSNVQRIGKPINESVEEERNTVWIEPFYSCELKYASMSSNDTYREPVFLKIFKTSESI